MLLEELLDLDLLDRMIDEGYVRVQRHPTEPLSILNYTAKAQYGRVWNDVTRQCRGLIVRGVPDRQDDEGHLHYQSVVVARPWPKFYNYGEHEQAVEYDLSQHRKVYPESDWQFRLDPSEPCEVTDKMDGSLGILYRYGDGTLAIATRGSFESEQALHATKVLQERYEDFAPLDDLTYLFEIVYPENRVVVNYGGMDDLVLLDVLETETGLPSYDYRWVSYTGPWVTVFEEGTLADALARPPRANAEGVVVRFEDGRMLKIKQDDYVALHRIITGLNERVVWERLGAGETHADICAGLPDEFEEWIKDVGTRLILEAALIEGAARDEHNEIVRNLGRFGRKWTRKEYAERASVSPLRPYLFLLLDDRDPRSAIWRSIKPRADAPMLSVTEDTA